MSQHTAGPWRVEQKHDLWQEIRAGYDFGNVMIADCVYPHNARLIACAPELLAACRKTLHYFETDAAGIHPEMLVDSLRATIAKAEGQTP